MKELFPFFYFYFNGLNGETRQCKEISNLFESIGYKKNFALGLDIFF
jgi:hypothetical protein